MERKCWEHGGWGKGVGSSEFPHLNCNLGDTTGHIYIESKIKRNKDRSMWDRFKSWFSKDKE